MHGSQVPGGLLEVMALWASGDPAPLQLSAALLCMQLANLAVGIAGV